jgi:hypothetical protein
MGDDSKQMENGQKAQRQNGVSRRRDGGFSLGRRSFVKGTTAISTIGGVSAVGRGAASSGSYVVEQTGFEDLQGKPSYNVGTDRGFYLWVTGRTVHVRWTGNTDVTDDVHVVDYHLQTDGAIESVNRVLFESNEDSLNVGDAAASGRAAVGGGEDGFDVTLKNATEITFDCGFSKAIDGDRWRSLSDSEKYDLTQNAETSRQPSKVFLGGDESTAGSLPITLGQTTTSTEVTPLSYGSQTVDEFYGDSDTDSTSGVERSDVSVLFLYKGPGGLGLVAIHDTASDYSGGAVSFQFDGLPTSDGDWVVEDDPHDFDGSETEPLWSWGDGYKDGGAFRGGLADGFDVTIHPAFNDDAKADPSDPRTPGKIREWQFLSGDASNPERIPLDMSSPVTIRSGAGGGTSRYDAVKQEKLKLAGRITDVSHVDEKARVESALEALGDRIDSGDMDEATAVEAVERMKLCEDVTEAAVTGWGLSKRVTPEDGDTLVGEPPYVEEHSTTGKMVKAAVNILVEAALSALSIADLLKKLGPVRGILKRAKSKIDDFVAYVGRTLLHDYDDLVWKLRDKVSGVVDGLYDLIVNGGVSGGTKLARKQANDTLSIREFFAGVVASGVENDDLVPYEIPVTTVDDKLQDVDDELAGGGQPSFSGSLDDAEVANGTATSAIYETVEETQSNFEALFTYLDIVGWVSVIGAALLATGFFAPIGAAYELGIFIVNLILNIGASSAALSCCSICSARTTTRWTRSWRGRGRCSPCRATRFPGCWRRSRTRWKPATWRPPLTAWSASRRSTAT